MKRRYISAVLTLFFILTCVFPASAKDDRDVIVSMQINNPMMKINGVKTEIDTGRGTGPVIRNDRTLIPIRAVVEAFGGTVEWDGKTRSVFLSLEEDDIRLTVDSTDAFINGQQKKLDVAPAVIHDRTMLPIRFVAEGFQLGVAWESDTKTVSIIRNGFDEAEYNALMRILPPYSGKAYAEINGNRPYFKNYEIINGSFEFYSKQDELGRCDVCFASVGEDLMPTEERESIASVKPTGWLNATYDTVPGGYLYNRCHLIGYQLTGENANERNLITGTRYLNIEGMLPFENAIADYTERTNNQVMYRVTPVFIGNNLVADGVLLEAYSVEDGGKGISFCVYCYNVQPTVTIDYATGKSFFSGTENSESHEEIAVTNEVYRTPTGKRYHFSPTCGGKNSTLTTLQEALAAGLTPCAKCAS